MSYALLPYAIDLELLRSAICSKDASLVDAVVAKNPRAFRDREEDEEISLLQALSTLVVGGDFNEECAHVYGYALEQLCHYLGKALDVRHWDAVGSRTLMVTSVEDILEKSGPPIPIPKIPDFPTIGYIPEAEIAFNLARIRGQRTLCSEKALLDLFDELEGWMETALTQKTSLVFFYY